MAFNGTYYKLWAYVGSAYVEIAKGIDNSLETSRTMIEISNKTDGKWAKFMPGRINGTVSGSFQLENEADVSAYYSWGDMWAAYVNGTSLVLQMGTNNVGDSDTVHTVYVSSLNKTASDDDRVTFDATFQITGEIVSGS